MKRNLTFFVLLFFMFSCSNLYADNISIRISIGSEYNSFTGKETDLTDKQLFFSVENNADGSIFMEIYRETGENDTKYSCLKNGSSSTRDDIYIKGLNNAVLRDRFEKFGMPVAYYEIISKSPLDDRQGLFAIACYNILDDYFIIIKDDTYQSMNLDTPLFTTQIVANVNATTFVRIVKFLDTYIPRIAKEK